MVLAHFAGSGAGVINLPAWALAYGVFMILVLTVLWTRARYVAGRPRPPQPPPSADDPGRSRPATFIVWATVAAQCIWAAVLVMLVIIAWTGRAEIGSNVAPIAVVGVYWALGGWVPLLFGRWWTATDPFLLAARIGDRRNRSPQRLSWWPGALVFTTFIVVWVAWLAADNPRNLAVWLTAYVLVMAVVAGRAGSELLRRVNVLPRILDYCAAILPRPGGRPASTSSDRRLDGLLATMVLAAVGGDRFTGSGWYSRNLTDRSALVITLSNLAVIAVIGLGIAGAWWAVEHRVETSRGEPGSRPISGALMPIAGSVLLAHMFLIGAVQLENFVVLASDPFSRGWNLFGTIFWQISQSPVSPMIGGITQALVLLAGHMAALGSLARQATAEVAGASTVRTRNRNWTATLPAAALVIASGVAWTLLLLGT